MEENETREYLEARQATYRLLASMFLKEVPVSFLEELSLNAESYEDAMGDYARSLREVDLEQARKSAGADFARLLLSMSANPVHPYESVYASDRHLMMQEPRDKVVAAYRSQGFKCSDDVRLPEDHLGIEFEFMAALCQKEMTALDEADATAVVAARAAQAEFVREHLLTWVPNLCDDILVRTKQGLYAGLAEMTRSFLEFEAEELELA